ncbi:hypothetical protein [Rhodocaloribacter sp.]
MKTYHFELILEAPPTEAEEDRLFTHFEGRVSPALVNGTPVLYVHLNAPSMEEAIRSAIEKTRSLGLSVKRVELDPDAVTVQTA